MLHPGVVDQDLDRPDPASIAATAATTCSSSVTSNRGRAPARAEPVGELGPGAAQPSGSTPFSTTVAPAAASPAARAARSPAGPGDQRHPAGQVERVVRGGDVVAGEGKTCGRLLEVGRVTSSPSTGRRDQPAQAATYVS